MKLLYIYKGVNLYDEISIELHKDTTENPNKIIAVYPQRVFSGEEPVAQVSITSLTNVNEFFYTFAEPIYEATGDTLSTAFFFINGKWYHSGDGTYHKNIGLVDTQCEEWLNQWFGNLKETV